MKCPIFLILSFQLHEQCSIIITTNKSLQKWAETPEDDVLAGALSGRLLFHCEVIKLSGKSYRMEKLLQKSGQDNRGNKIAKM